jgi:hypothetical protein
MLGAGGIQPAMYPIHNETTLDPVLTKYCAPKHWDPTMVYRYTVPQGPSQALPMDPRPWAKICLNYVNSGAAEQAPSIPASMVVTGAGEFYPPNRYMDAIDNESALRRLDRPLNRDLPPGNDSCFPQQYVLPPTSDAYQQYILLPPQRPPMSKMVQELEIPKVIEKIHQYSCSEKAMMCDMSAAPRFFNNHTRLQKYKQKDDTCGSMLWQTNGGKDPSSTNLPKL